MGRKDELSASMECGRGSMVNGSALVVAKRRQAGVARIPRTRIIGVFMSTLVRTSCHSSSGGYGLDPYIF